MWGRIPINVIRFSSQRVVGDWRDGPARDRSRCRRNSLDFGNCWALQPGSRWRRIFPVLISASCDSHPPGSDHTQPAPHHIGLAGLVATANGNLYYRAFRNTRPGFQVRSCPQRVLRKQKCNRSAGYPFRVARWFAIHGRPTSIRRFFDDPCRTGTVAANLTGKRFLAGFKTRSAQHFQPRARSTCLNTSQSPEWRSCHTRRHRVRTEARRIQGVLQTLVPRA